MRSLPYRLTAYNGWFLMGYFARPWVPKVIPVATSILLGAIETAVWAHERWGDD
ncbi:hypothetical protein [Herbaspirillum sp.]|uniref:hypothetical protein n=1 Tax=Herbaspirillum sp. TaxID=1890675 RepID=UPI002582903F|nr:hypothetical protein [Herbaspirillum sp.]MCP3949449.1 hypothetical protein [Herbaspirillum sp.]MCP4222077.1 hypothetical protein [Actinomycetes bacterium]